MNGVPVALQSRDLASAAAEVDAHHPLHRRRGLHIVRDDVFFFENVISHSFRRSSSQNQTRFLGSDFVFVEDVEREPLLLVLSVPICYSVSRRKEGCGWMKSEC